MLTQTAFFCRGKREGISTFTPIPSGLETHLKCPNPEVIRSEEGGNAEKGSLTRRSNRAQIARRHQIPTHSPHPQYLNSRDCRAFFFWKYQDSGHAPRPLIPS